MRRFLFASLLLLAACGPSFGSFRKIEKSRVIGAEISVQGDPLRWTPAPDETATLTLVTADFGPEVQRSFAIVVCKAGTSALDVAFCDPSQGGSIVGMSVYAAPTPTDGGMVTPPVTPSVEFDVPSLADLGDSTELWVTGLVCNGGAMRDLFSDPPQVGVAYDPCEPAPDAEVQPYGQVIATRIKLQVGANDPNHVPQLQTITFGGQSWPELASDEAPDTGCAGVDGGPSAGYVVVRAGSETPLTFTALPSSFESYYDEQQEKTLTERAYVQPFFTRGRFDRGYAAIDDASSIGSMTYEAPAAADVDASGTLVRLWLRVYDDRQASTYVRRALCVVP